MSCGKVMRTVDGRRKTVLSCGKLF